MACRRHRSQHQDLDLVHQTLGPFSAFLFVNVCAAASCAQTWRRGAGKELVRSSWALFGWRCLRDSALWLGTFSASSGAHLERAGIELFGPSRRVLFRRDLPPIDVAIEQRPVRAPLSEPYRNEHDKRIRPPRVPRPEWQTLDSAHHLHPFTDPCGFEPKKAPASSLTRRVYTSTTPMAIECWMVWRVLWCVTLGYGRSETCRGPRVSKCSSSLTTIASSRRAHPPAIELARLLG